MLDVLKELKKKYLNVEGLDGFIDSVQDKMDDSNEAYTEVALFLNTVAGWRVYDIKDKSVILERYRLELNEEPEWFVAECESISEFMMVLNSRFENPMRANTLRCTKDDILNTPPTRNITDASGEVTVENTKRYLGYLLNRDLSVEFEEALRLLETVSEFGEITAGLITPRQALIITCTVCVNTLIEVIEKFSRLELMDTTSTSLSKVYGITGGNTLKHITDYVTRVYGHSEHEHKVTPRRVIGWVKYPSFAKYGTPIGVKYKNEYTVTLTPMQQLVVLSRCSPEHLSTLLDSLYLLETKYHAPHMEDELTYAIAAYSDYINKKITPVNVKVIETMDMNKGGLEHLFQYTPGKYLVDPTSGSPSLR
jgi:hypothetical protein